VKFDKNAYQKIEPVRVFWENSLKIVALQIRANINFLRFLVNQKNAE